MGKSLQAFCTESGRDELLREWDAEKNAPLKFADLTVGSSKLIKERMCHSEETSNSQLINISVVSHLVARTGVCGRYRRRYTRTGGNRYLCKQHRQR